MASLHKKKEPLNQVDQQKNLAETIRKEKRHQQLYTTYSINPFKKLHVLTSKPNSVTDTEDGTEDTHFKSVIKRANLEPVRKYEYPQTESQEIGWVTQPLVTLDRSDRRLHFSRNMTDVTKFMEAVWMMKERSEN